MNPLTDKQFYDRNGYVIARGVFSPDEVESFKAHYMAMRAAGTYPLDSAGIDLGSDDPLKRYPRMIHMHRWDTISLDHLLDSRLTGVVTTLLETPPLAVQTMLYFKPAGARGQAMHQDQHYLRARPGTCMAAWLALDACDEENGCMQVIPGSHQWPVLCPEKADTQASFTDVTVPIPPDSDVVPCLMAAGDVLFFNGTLVHGSFPNTSKDRFRRALICHYIEGRAEQVTDYDHPVLRLDGTIQSIANAPGGGPCGVYVPHQGGAPQFDLKEQAAPLIAPHE